MKKKKNYESFKEKAECELKKLNKRKQEWKEKGIKEKTTEYPVFIQLLILARLGIRSYMCVALWDLNTLTMVCQLCSRTITLR